MSNPFLDPGTGWYQKSSENSSVFGKAERPTDVTASTINACTSFIMEHTSRPRRPVDRYTRKLTDCCLNRRTINECASFIPSFLRSFLMGDSISNVIVVVAAAVAGSSARCLASCDRCLTIRRAAPSRPSVPRCLPTKHCSQSLSFFCQVQIKGKNKDSGDKFSPERAAFYAVLSFQRQTALRIAPLLSACLSVYYLSVYISLTDIRYDMQLFKARSKPDKKPADSSARLQNSEKIIRWELQSIASWDCVTLCRSVWALLRDP